jgi:hypothetical protein
MEFELASREASLENQLASQEASLENQLASQEAYVPGEDGTYSQNYQDQWIASVARHNGWDKHDGFFLDLGAFHGLQCSNTALVEKQFGWKGVCVEPRPLPGAFSERDCVLVERPLSGEAGQEVKFYGIVGSQRQQLDSAVGTGESEGTTMATLSASELFSCVNKTSAACKGVHGNTPVPNFINFISMDLEGQEPKVLSTFPFDKVKVGAWIIETNKDPNIESWMDKVMNDNGYMIAPVSNSGVDRYYIQPQFWHPSLTGKGQRVHPEGSNGC